MMWWWTSMRCGSAMLLSSLLVADDGRAQGAEVADGHLHLVAVLQEDPARAAHAQAGARGDHVARPQGQALGEVLDLLGHGEEHFRRAGVLVGFTLGVGADGEVLRVGHL